LNNYQSLPVSFQPNDSRSNISASFALVD
jgi:hypothetical protein